MQTKGQLSIFIILGILVILVVVALIVMNYRVTLSPLEDVKKPIAQLVPFEIQPLHDFIQACIYQVGKQGLRELGDRGGYLRPALRYNKLEPTEGDGVLLAPNSDLVIPYWFHLASRNDCTGTCEFSSKRPALFETAGQVSIEGQLNTYIKENTPHCLRNFESFQGEYTVVPKGELTVETSIAAKEVYFLVKYPLEVKKGDATFQIKDVLAIVDVNLREIYTLASDITNAQAEKRFLEQYARNLIDGFSDLDEKALPPVTAFTIDFGPGVFWVKDNVVKRLQSLFHAYIPLLQVFGARNYRFIEAPKHKKINDRELYQVLYNRGALIPLNSTPKTVNVRFATLDWWKPYVDLNCRGQLCKGQSFSNTLGFVFGMQQYQFAYDLSFPVLVEIDNPDAFNKEGYSFKFFLEANIRNNKPLPVEFRPLTGVDLPIGSLLCDVDKRDSGPITLTVLNGKTKKPIDKAFVTFTCGGESCAFGPVINGSATLKMPLCLGATLGFEKNDVHPAYVPIDTFLNESDNVTVLMEPFRRFSVSIKNFLLRKSGSGWELDTNNLLAQEPDEETTIQLERITGPYDEPFFTFINIKGDAFSTTKDYDKDIPLIPGRYRVIISTLKYADPPLVIPKRRMEISKGPFSSSEEIELPRIEFNETHPLPTVSTEFEWDVTKEYLDTYNHIEFRGIRVGIDKVPQQDRTIEDLEGLKQVDEYYKAYPQLLVPEWSHHD